MTRLAEALARVDDAQRAARSQVPDGSLGDFPLPRELDALRELADAVREVVPAGPIVTIVRAVQTCYACPSQWDAWDSEGNYWYLRYRFGSGTATKGEPQMSADRSFEHGDPLDGVISLEEFCELAGLRLRLA